VLSSLNFDKVIRPVSQEFHSLFKILFTKLFLIVFRVLPEVFSSLKAIIHEMSGMERKISTRHHFVRIFVFQNLYKTAIKTQ
jgi:hypothetical protein